MKRFALVLLCTMLSGLPQTSEGSHPKYVLIYTEYHQLGGGIDPCMAHGACWTETHSELFLTLKDAQARMNKDVFFSDGFDHLRALPITKENFVGLYAITEIPVNQVKIGVEEKPVTEIKKVDKLEWRVKQ